MELVEIIVSQISQNAFIKLLNETCVIEPTDSAEEAVGKKKKLVALMMTRIRAELTRLAKEDPELKAIMDEAFKEQRQAEEGADQFVNNCKDLFKQEGKK